MEKPPNTPPPILTMQRRSWMLGAVDAFHERAARAEIDDALAYASGRVEGQAWREQGLDLADMLTKNRLPSPVPRP
jgi:hypothetical protein